MKESFDSVSTCSAPTILLQQNRTRPNGIRKSTIHVHGVRLQCRRRNGLPHHRFQTRTAACHPDQQLCSLQRTFCATAQRERKCFLTADKQDEDVQFSLTLRDFSDFPQKLRAYRKKLALTQEAMAQFIGTNPLTLRTWEQGKAKPPYRMIRKCLKRFDEKDDSN